MTKATPRHKGSPSKNTTKRPRGTTKGRNFPTLSSRLPAPDTRQRHLTTPRKKSDRMNQS